ncbi:hypothetical protein PSACC_03129 [Paramicrosporidium saccamoebae]|uniref:Uncharacterized protein n=1 Tax=Paramicrosporidium saccamoebae TaxID=1246581 RepID=A0A2H9TH81_9FUNG|nr:hypothetical protein PSACC_03129 [Paramicrosporidium saccamoebae]
MTACKQHSECSTGYCKNAVCVKPKEHEPCRPNQCPSGLTCFEPLNRCKKPNGTWDGRSCKYIVQCHPRQYCLNSQCVDRPDSGESCNGTKMCYSGYSCLKGVCVANCSKNGECGSGEECKATKESLPYRICVAQPKPVKKPTPTPTPTPAPKPKPTPTPTPAPKPTPTPKPVVGPPVTPPSKPDPDSQSPQSWRDFFKWENVSKKDVLIPLVSVIGAIIVLSIILAYLYYRKKRRQAPAQESSLGPSMPPMEPSNYMAAPPSYHDVSSSPAYVEKQ